MYNGQTNVSPPGKTGVPGKRGSPKVRYLLRDPRLPGNLVLYTYICLAVYVTPRMSE